jgi:ankyrin repeat protein
LDRDIDALDQLGGSFMTWQLPTSLVFHQIPTAVERKGPTAEETAPPQNSPRAREEVPVITRALKGVTELPGHEHALGGYLMEGLDEGSFTAIQNKDLGALKFLIDTGAKPTRDLLYYAVEYENHAAIELLLSSSVQPTIRELELALDSDDQKSAELLLTGGLRPDDVIVVARNTATIKFLTEHGADINKPRMGRDTLLNMACDVYDLDWLEALITCGADVNRVNGNGQTPLVWVIKESPRRPQQISEMVQILLKHEADPNHLADGGHAPLATTYYMGYLDIARELLKYGADPNVRTESGKWLLELACAKGDDKFVQLLLEHKADPNVRTNDGHTLLGETCRRGHLECARLLLENKACPNARGGMDWTALHLICMAGKVQTKLFSLLLLYGAYPYSRDLTGTVPLDYVRLRKNADLAELDKLIVEMTAERQKLPTPSGAEIDETELARRSVTLEAFNDRWGFASVRMNLDLEVRVGSSYSTREHGMAVIEGINGWLLDRDKPLGPVVALLELVAEKAQEQRAQDTLKDLREQVRDLVAYHASSKDTATFQRARVLEANLPDNLR